VHALIQVVTSCLLLITVATLSLLVCLAIDGYQFGVTSDCVVCIIGLICVLRHDACRVALTELRHLAVRLKLLGRVVRCWIKGHERVVVGHVCLCTHLHLLEHLELLELQKLSERILLFSRHERIMGYCRRVERR
jgi:hypothetical protein